MIKNTPKYLAFAIALLLADNSFAQRASTDNFSNTPSIVVGGFINTNAGVRSQKSAYAKDRLIDTQETAGTEDPTTGTHNRMSNPDFTNDSEIHIKVGGISEYGMKYGAIVELEADVSTSARNEGFNADKSYIFTESVMGKWEFGNNIAANQKMKVGPETFARAAGGINGKYLEYINMPMLADGSRNGITQIGNCSGFRVSNGGAPTATGSDCSNIKLPRFILIPQSPIAHGGYAKGFYNRSGDNDYSASEANSAYGFNKNKTTSQIRDGSFGDLEDATKVTYYTPRISGWQGGLSFTPDTGNSGTSAAISGNDSGDIKSVVSFGVNYSNSFDNLGFAVSLTGEQGKYEQSTSATIKRENLNAYEVGLMATYAGFSLGWSYGSWGKSLQPKTGPYSCQYDPNLTIAQQDCGTTIVAGATNKKFGASTYWTGGAAYQFGPIAASLTYINSEFQKNQYSAASFGVDYKMAKGLMPYIEVTKFSLETDQAKYSNGTTTIDQGSLPISARQIKDNSGYVVLAGLLFAF